MTEAILIFHLSNIVCLLQNNNLFFNIQPKAMGLNMSSFWEYLGEKYLSFLSLYYFQRRLDNFERKICIYSVEKRFLVYICYHTKIFIFIFLLFLPPTSTWSKCSFFCSGIRRSCKFCCLCLCTCNLSYLLGCTECSHKVSTNWEQTLTNEPFTVWRKNTVFGWKWRILVRKLKSNIWTKNAFCSLVERSLSYLELNFLSRGNEKSCSQN